MFRPTEIARELPPDILDGVAVIQPRLSRTDQLQSLRPDTDTLRLPPPAPKLTDDGDTRDGEDGHGARPASWETPTRRPPIVTAPDRPPPEFTCARIATEPPPDTRDGTDSQPRSPRTDQLQSLRPDTDTLRPPPPAPKLTDDGDTRDGEDGHGARPASWETPTRRPPIVTAPDRPPPEFLCARIVTEPPPDTRDGTDSQPRSSRTDQLQSLRPDTDTLRLPPPAPKPTEDGDTRDGEDGHGAGLPACDTLTRMLSHPPRNVTVPVRAAVVGFRDARIVAPDRSTVIQSRSALANKPIPRHGTDVLGVTTRTVADPPACPNRTDRGVTSGAGQGRIGRRSWDTLTDRPPIVTVPLRAPERLTATRTRTVPAPDARAGVGVIQSRSSLTDQPQSRRPDTDTLSVPPAAPNRNDRGDTPPGVDGHRPGCRTVNTAPATVSLPVRADDPVFACTR